MKLDAKQQANITKPSFPKTKVAFCLPGKTWRRKIVKTEAALERLLEKLYDDAAQVQIRKLES